MHALRSDASISLDPTLSDGYKKMNERSFTLAGDVVLGSVSFAASGVVQAPVLGYPRRDPVGDNEPLSSAGDVFVGF
jgi:hypothetical protein